MLLVLGPAKQVRAGKAARANDGEVRFVIVQGLYKGARNQQRAAKCGQGAEDQTSRGAADLRECQKRNRQRNHDQRLVHPFGLRHRCHQWHDRAKHWQGQTMHQAQA